MRAWRYLLIFIPLYFSSCSDNGGDSKNDSFQYVKPSVDYRGRYRKGYVRKKVSTDKNAYKKRARSRYYYQTRGKYLRKSRKKS
jgi:hypothetical protein